MTAKPILKKEIQEKDMTVRELSVLMSQGFVSLKDYVYVRFDTVEGRLDKVERGIVDLREDMIFEFKAIDERFTKVEARLETVESRLDGVDYKLDGIETRLDTVEPRLISIEQKIIHPYEFKLLSRRVDTLEQSR